MPKITEAKKGQREYHKNYRKKHPRNKATKKIKSKEELTAEKEGKREYHRQYRKNNPERIKRINKKFFSQFAKEKSV
jgi:peptide methionine sulfoxide reductase MsrA